MLKTIIPFTLISLIVIGCGSSSNSKKTIDMLDYLPSQDTTKTYLQTIKTKEGEQERNTFVEEVSIDGKTTSIKVSDTLDRTYEAHEESIIQKEYGVNPSTITMQRFVSKGAKLYTLEKSTHNKKITLNDLVVGSQSIESKKVCKFDSELPKLDSYSIPYKDDILKFECVKTESIETKINEEWEGKLTDYKSGSIESDYDLSYFYLKKGVGVIVEIDNNCYVTEDEISRVNDKAKTCEQESSVHNFFLD